MRALSRGRYFVPCCIAAILACSHARGAEQVTVLLTDGRQVSGFLDPTSTNQLLRLKRSFADVEIVSSFPRDLVHSTYRSETLPLAVDGRNSSRNPGPPPPDAGNLAHQAEAGGFVPLSQHPRSPGTVKTLVVEAHLAQWDRDAQPDGLRVMVWPLSERGDVVPVHGQLELTLFVEQEGRGAVIGSQPQPAFKELDRANYLVSPERFAAGPAIFTLPFQRQHPDEKTAIANEALLYARLGIPGLGVFEASDAQVNLRECSRFRDQLQQFEHRRYLPIEAGPRLRP
jgi:hypothetical protein